MSRSRKDVERYKWNRAAESFIHNLNTGASLHGRIDWTTLDYLRLQGIEPLEAAKRILEKHSEVQP